MRTASLLLLVLCCASCEHLAKALDILLLPSTQTILTELHFLLSEYEDALYCEPASPEEAAAATATCLRNSRRIEELIQELDRAGLTKEADEFRAQFREIMLGDY